LLKAYPATSKARAEQGSTLEQKLKNNTFHFDLKDGTPLNQYLAKLLTITEEYGLHPDEEKPIVKLLIDNIMPLDRKKILAYTVTKIYTIWVRK
jgi:hypothetical protein